ncbi:hypothetical protein E2C01_048368 [Portunus trituberculatus]|uniref:Uncharacterized protein n=1 Tax=Portunus trituberculatus TaxID=210409 RepID=A0A5B7G686_PORTR|nr:hypothetical protein [Portunus trituberculatus]
MPLTSPPPTPPPSPLSPPGQVLHRHKQVRRETRTVTAPLNKNTACLPCPPPSALLPFPSLPCSCLLCPAIAPLVSD